LKAVSRLWWASMFSSGSTWTMQVALAVHVLREADVSALAVVELAGTLPALLMMPFAGTLADRLDPRRLAIASMIAQTVCVAAMATLMSGSWLWPIAVAYALQGLSNTVWPPARQQWLYRQVEPSAWARANAALGSVGGVTTVAGAGLGGVLSAWTPVGAMAVAAVLQVLAVVPLVALARTPLPPPAERAEPTERSAHGLRAQLIEGLRGARRLPLAASVVWVGIAWGCIGGAYTVLLAGRVVDDLHGGPAVLGSFYAVDGIAVVAGTLLVRGLPVRRQIAAYAVAYVVQGVAWAALFVVGALMPAVLALAVMRLASGVIIALDTTILLATVPGHLRGRITSLHMTTYSAMARVSLALFGILLTVTDVQVLGVISGSASAFIGAIWWWTHRGRGERAFVAAHKAAPAAG
jgi:MFS family permease